MPISGSALRRSRPRRRPISGSALRGTRPKKRQTTQWEAIERKTKNEFELSLAGPRFRRSREVTEQPKDIDAMSAAEQVAAIRKSLLKEYGFDLGQWYSDSDLTDRGFTFNETLELIKKSVDSVLYRHPEDIVSRIGQEAMDRLRVKFLGQGS